MRIREALALRLAVLTLLVAAAAPVIAEAALGPGRASAQGHYSAITAAGHAMSLTISPVVLQRASGFRPAKIRTIDGGQVLSPSFRGAGVYQPASADGRWKPVQASGGWRVSLNFN
jgi:hypothetical protein